MATTARPPVELLPEGSTSLARGIPESPAGTLFVLGDRGGIRVEPGRRFQVVFGRNEPDVHVCLGREDPGVSRRHGLIGWDDDAGWSLRNTGLVPIRFPGSRLLLSGHEEPIGPTYTPVFIPTEQREHLLELRVAGRPRAARSAEDGDSTVRPATWTLTDRERLALVALGERYLRHEAHPQPAAWATVAERLDVLQPSEGWTAKQASWVVARVRERLVEAGVVGLTREQVGEPVGNAINHNLLRTLLLSTSLVPPDVRLLDGPTGTAGAAR